MVDRFTVPISQAWVVPELERFTASTELASLLQLFLISGKVDELSLATIKDYSVKIGSFVKFCKSRGINSTDQLNSSVVRVFLLELRQHNSPGSVLGYYKCVNRFFNWLVYEDRLSQSPMAKLRPPKTPQKVILPFSREQVACLLSWCDLKTFVGARNRAIILVLLDTGLRRRELADINLGDVDFDREVIKVMGKGAKERLVGISKSTQKVLLYYLLKREDNYKNLWVTEERKPFAAGGIRMMIERLGKRAGLKGVRCSPHTFRHTFATEAIRNGADSLDVQLLLGHEDPRMTRRYLATVKSDEAVKAHRGTDKQRGFSPVENMGIK